MRAFICPCMISYSGLNVGPCLYVCARMRTHTRACTGVCICFCGEDHTYVSLCTCLDACDHCIVLEGMIYNPFERDL